MSSLTAVAVVAPMAGTAGVVVALVAVCFLLPLMFYYILNSPGFQQTHVHHHYQEPHQERRPYTEGHERKALLPNGTQVQERIVRRYDQ
jgi:hypothetical protein